MPAPNDRPDNNQNDKNDSTSDNLKEQGTVWKEKCERTNDNQNYQAAQQFF